MLLRRVSSRILACVGTTTQAAVARELDRLMPSAASTALHAAARHKASHSDAVRRPKRMRKRSPMTSAATSAVAAVAPPSIATGATAEQESKEDAASAAVRRRSGGGGRRLRARAAAPAAVNDGGSDASHQILAEAVLTSSLATPPSSTAAATASTTPADVPVAKPARSTAARLPQSVSARVREQVRRKRRLLELKKSAQTAPVAAAATAADAPRPPSSPLVYPDYRERVLVIFAQLAETNLALGERYKAQSYHAAVERLKRSDFIFAALPANLRPLPPGAEQQVGAGTATADEVAEQLAKRKAVLASANSIRGIGEKLHKKIVEILQTGELQELKALEQRPVVRALRELTQLHGFGPRTAINFFRQYGVSTVEELRQRVAAQDAKAANPSGSGAPGAAKPLRLTDAQRLGLQYYGDIQQRIPHAEGRLHEAVLKLRLRKYLGPGYELTVCGSFRRRVPEAGDIDVLITHRAGSGSTAPPAADALARFVRGLTAERYIEAAFAQGATKFMGMCRLRSAGGRDEPPKRRYTARRLDIRFVDVACYPAALLYFTGSKNFNVVMRAKAIKQRLMLNEYGLFRNPPDVPDGTTHLHEMISKLARAQYFSIREATADAAPEETEAGDTDENQKKTKRSKTRQLTPRERAELQAILVKVNRLRVKVSTEKEVFAALGMPYVPPEQRSV